jgi:hypothetical protein
MQEDPRPAEPQALWLSNGSSTGTSLLTLPESISFAALFETGCSRALLSKPPSSASKMAEYKPQAVKDVPANEFIAAYAAHLKSTDKVRTTLRPAAISHT